MTAFSTLDSTIVLGGTFAALGLTVGAFLIRSRRTYLNRLSNLDRSLEKMEQLLSAVQDEWRYQHRQGTYVGTIEGLWRVLELGAEEGGLDIGLRRRIYQAGDEMFSAFHAQLDEQVGPRTRLESFLPTTGELAHQR